MILNPSSTQPPGALTGGSPPGRAVCKSVHTLGSSDESLKMQSECLVLIQDKESKSL